MRVSCVPVTAKRKMILILDRHLPVQIRDNLLLAPVHFQQPEKQTNIIVLTAALF